ncbi:hypothetical protein LTR08_002752 [Meristemomyces frigidus]|nr:hypothetical protein LTR08_002752 [Meristemomyces frigidus]
MAKTKDTPVSAVNAKGAVTVDAAGPAKKRKAERIVDGESNSNPVAAKKHKTEAEETTRSSKKNARREKQTTEASEGVRPTTEAHRERSTVLVQLPQSPRGHVHTANTTSRVVAAKQPSGWSVSACTAGRFTNHDPVFVRNRSTNQDFLLAASGREIQVLSIDTSLPVRSCPAPDGQSICCYAVDPSLDQTSVRLAYTDGSMAAWDWASDKRATSVYHVEGKPEALAVANAGDSHNFTLVRAGQYSTIYHEQAPLYSTKKLLQSIQVLGDVEYVIAHGPTAILLGKRTGDMEDAANPEFIWLELPMPRGITCLDARFLSGADADKRDGKRRSTLSLAVGDVKGQIHLYGDLTSLFAPKGQASLPTPRLLHWHREAVSAVKFSKDGNYLISGGKETVLVLWQLETGKQQFLPHLTSDIERIVVSPEGDKYAVQMGDNSIMVLSTSELKPVANFAGLQLAPLSNATTSTSAENEGVAPKKSVAAVLHPDKSNQLLLAVPATQPKSHSDSSEARPFLQTFDLRTSRHITRQALTRNNVTDFNLGPEETPIVPPDVAHLAISSDGQWLATVDEWKPPASDLQHLVRDDGEQLNQESRKRREEYLKIWKWDAEQALWTLSTRIDGPHVRSDTTSQGAGRLFQLVADPSSATGFASIGEDSCVKLWKPRTRIRHGVVVKGQDDTEVIEWVCRRMIELPRQAGRFDSPVDAAEILAQPTTAFLTWSEDGSTLAATQNFACFAEQPLVHFIGTTFGDIKRSLSGLAHHRLEGIAFLDRYFVAVSRGDVHVWDLVTSRLLHQHDLPHRDVVRPAILAVNATDATFAVAVGTRVSVYDPNKVAPVYKTKCEDDIVGLLAGRKAKGYTLLFADATVRTLSSSATAGGALKQATPSLSTAEDLQQAVALTVQSAGEGGDGDEADVEMSDATLALPAAAAEAQTPWSVGLESAEDDRPVVRPEELARVFDVGQSFAMPPVREMFEAVIGLFGRKPLINSVGGVDV